MAGVAFLPEVLDHQSDQAESDRPIRTYLDSVCAEERVRSGRTMVRRHRDLFNAIEATYGVEPEIVAAIWGVESKFGTQRGNFSVLSALATLAYDGRRAAYFEEELANALRILQSRQIRLSGMLGSWAGAMGHGQFMPSSYLDFAVDFDGDGKSDIWSRDPTDALASVAHFLTKHGWRKGQPWGLEVELPDKFDFSLTGLDQTATTREWRERGVCAADQTPLPDYGTGSIILPSGRNGVALLVLRNFLVMMRYNRAEHYAIAVGHLADRIGGERGFCAPWPEDETPLSKADIAEAQILLTASGFDTEGVDGRRGPKTQNAVRGYQLEHGLCPDGYVDFPLLERLRRDKTR